MAAAANYGRPKPVDPLHWVWGAYIRARCACGNSLCEPVGVFARRQGLDDRLQCQVVLSRLRCRLCGAKPIHCDVAKDRR
jgi:hypothetical protein